MEYNVKAKVGGKYQNFGKIKDGKYGPQLSFKNTKEFKQLVMDAGDWINFALFEPKEQDKTISPETQEQLDKLKSEARNDQTIPF